jgi:hypothetical protein
MHSIAPLCPEFSEALVYFPERSKGGCENVEFETVDDDFLGNSGVPGAIRDRPVIRFNLVKRNVVNEIEF